MKKILIALAVAFLPAIVSAQQTGKKEKLINGIYFQWGYNREWYTRSTIHFRMANGDNFKLLKVKAGDKPDMDAVFKAPTDISIPQYNYRLGFYINKARTRAIELNFDHAKYVVRDFQRVHVTGTIDGQQVDADSILDPARFLHFEHTDGANWLHINYVGQKTLFMTRSGKRPLLTTVYKFGAGINIPRTDFTWKGDRLNNKFHVAGYNFGTEGGLRFYPLKHLFLEATGKTGYVRYVNALANYKASYGNRASHGFGYFELIALVGYDFVF